MVRPQTRSNECSEHMFGSFFLLFVLFKPNICSVQNCEERVWQQSTPEKKGAISIITNGAQLVKCFLKKIKNFFQKNSVRLTEHMFGKLPFSRSVGVPAAPSFFVLLASNIRSILLEQKKHKNHNSGVKIFSLSLKIFTPELGQSFLAEQKSNICSISTRTFVRLKNTKSSQLKTFRSNICSLKKHKGWSFEEKIERQTEHAFAQKIPQLEFHRKCGAQWQ